MVHLRGLTQATVRQHKAKGGIRVKRAKEKQRRRDKDEATEMKKRRGD